ncbi:transcriptional regulator [Terriglobus roseus DSM 18391]|uniref:Transcriptional regulator n=1 Tax=Terriglobus roseus (strain DSM 18391 / NRRL B-41598 / KBS 63) TaxID=926566 RepID=I3ZEB6_TERRK|nr:GntR family transcriptional regulator [Terriglobus roseus]AFL87584.1 transcriptional regulator [Terriglobus roseus DSM 18391]
MSSLKKLQTSLSLTEQAHKSIRRYILAENPGADVRLTETFFAEQLGISKSPVREALNTLQSEGLLRIEPRRGAYVHQFSGKEISDLYNLREALETFAAAIVPITPKLITELRTSVARTEQLLRSRKKADYIEEDIFFHSMIVRSTGNEELARVHSNLQDKLWLCRCQTYQLTSSDTPSAHRNITEAITSGDRALAQQMTSSHIQFVRSALLGAWERARRNDETALIAPHAAGEPTLQA